MLRVIGNVLLLKLSYEYLDFYVITNIQCIHSFMFYVSV